MMKFSFISCTITSQLVSYPTLGSAEREKSLERIFLHHPVAARCHSQNDPPDSSEIAVQIEPL